MNRGLVATLLLALATGAAPAKAAPAAQPVVYEVVRTAAAPDVGRVTIHEDATAGEAVFLLANIQAEGSGYVTRLNGLSWRARGTGSRDVAVDLSRGFRFLVGGLRGRVRVEPHARGWSVREAGRGFRVVTAAAGEVQAAGPVAVERFRGAKAPGGPYGSLAYATVPCELGSGTWTFASDTEPWQGSPQRCAAAWAEAFAETRRGRTWTLDADVTGLNGWPYDAPDHRIVVLDYPKRPAGR